MQPQDDAFDYHAQIVTLRRTLAQVAEDVATSDLGGSQEIMRTALPPSPAPERHKHPLDGAQGLGLADHDAHTAHDLAAQQKPRKQDDQDSDDDASDDDESEDDADDDDQKE